MKHRLEKTPNLEIKQGTIEDLLVSSDRITGVLTKEGIQYQTKTVSDLFRHIFTRIAAYW